MDTEDLQMLREVVQFGSFAAVARRRTIDPSVVSRTISKLERRLGARLFHRTTRSLSLTETGARYLARIEPVLDELAAAGEAATAARGEPEGTLRMTASVAFGVRLLTPLAAGFRARYPRLKLELELSDTMLDLVENRIDLAIRLAPEIDADVICSRLMPTRYRVVASHDWLSANPVPHEPEDIVRTDCVLFSMPAYRTRWMFRDTHGRVQEVPVRGGVFSSSALQVRELMLAGAGPALLADWLIADDLAAGRCRDLFPAHDVAATSFDTAAWLIYPSRQFLPRKTRVIIDHLRETVAHGSQPETDAVGREQASSAEATVAT